MKNRSTQLHNGEMHPLILTGLLLFYNLPALTGKFPGAANITTQKSIRDGLTTETRHLRGATEMHMMIITGIWTNIW
jgi:hypothetical protein